MSRSIQVRWRSSRRILALVGLVKGCLLEKRRNSVRHARRRCFNGKWTAGSPLLRLAGSMAELRTRFSAGCSGKARLTCCLWRSLPPAKLVLKVSVSAKPAAASSLQLLNSQEPGQDVTWRTSTPSLARPATLGGRTGSGQCYAKRAVGAVPVGLLNLYRPLHAILRVFGGRLYMPCSPLDLERSAGTRALSAATRFQRLYIWPRSCQLAA